MSEIALPAPLPLVADSNEDLVHSPLLDSIRKEGIAIQVSHIDMDFMIIGHGVAAIEYKKVPDLLSRLTEGSLDDQMCRTADYDFPIPLVQGQLAPNKRGNVKVTGYKTRWRYNSVQGILFALQMRGIAVVHTTSDATTISALKTIYNQMNGDPIPAGHPFKFAKVAAFSPKESLQLKLISALPGINIMLAKRILAEYKTPSAFFSASREDMISRIRMLGQFRADEVKKCLETEVTEYDIAPTKKQTNTCRQHARRRKAGH